MSQYMLSEHKIIRIGNIMNTSMANVELIMFLAPSMLLCAIYDVSLFLNPLPKPMSIWSIHISRLLMVSHTPFLYFPRHSNVNGTIISTTSADHPFIKNDANTLSIRIDERFFF